MMCEDKVCHGRWHLKCCFKPLLGKLFWLLSVLALVLAWTASANADGVLCFQSRADNGTCPSGGLPVAHLFLDSIALGVLSLGLKRKHCMNGMMGGNCGDMESEK